MENVTGEDSPQRRAHQVLTEITRVDNYENNQVGSRFSSPDEMIIQMRGPKVMPLTWSPVDCNQLTVTSDLDTVKDKTPERHPIREMRPSLRRRLTLSPVKSSCCDKITPDIVYKKIKSLTTTY